MRLTVALLVAILFAGCVQKPETTPIPTPTGTLDPIDGFRLTSAAFADGADLPRANSCDGAGKSPPLEVDGAPPGATTIALIVGDPDAPLPQAPQQNFTHWIAWNAPLVDGTAAFPEGGVPRGTVEGANGGGSAGWTPPCPPQGSPKHRYEFTVYAVNGTLDLKAGASRAQLEGALKDKSVGSTVLTGLYARALVGR